MIDVTYDGFWIDMKSYTTWHSSDTERTTAHWVTGEPNLAEGIGCTISVYAASGSSYPGMWQGHYCDSLSVPFACERPKSGIVLTTSSQCLHWAYTCIV